MATVVAAVPVGAAVEAPDTPAVVPDDEPLADIVVEPELGQIVTEGVRAPEHFFACHFWSNFGPCKEKMVKIGE